MLQNSCSITCSIIVHDLFPVKTDAATGVQLRPAASLSSPCLVHQICQFTPVTLSCGCSSSCVAQFAAPFMVRRQITKTYSMLQSSLVALCAAFPPVTLAVALRSSTWPWTLLQQRRRAARASCTLLHLCQRDRPI